MIARLYLLPAYKLCIISTYIYMVGRYDIYTYMYYIYMSSCMVIISTITIHVQLCTITWCITVVNPRRACAARVTVVVLCVRLSATILALQATYEAAL